MTNKPIGVPSGWDNAAAYWYRDWEIDCLALEVCKSVISAENIEISVHPELIYLFDWREEPCETI